VFAAHPAELLLQHRLVDVNATANDKVTALHESAAHGNDLMARLLIEKGKAHSADSSPGFTPLHAACQAGIGPDSPLVELLLQQTPTLLAMQASLVVDMQLQKVRNKGGW
jgi:ankyrin repeat protein